MSDTLVGGFFVGWMNEFMPYGFAGLAELMDVLGHAGVAASKRAARRPKRGGTGAVRGRTLRPGTDTVLWNALADRIEPMLADYGAKARLARVLNVPRQRVHDYFVARTTMPDAERLLHLLGWLVMRETSPKSGTFPKPRD